MPMIRRLALVQQNSAQLVHRLLRLEPSVYKTGHVQVRGKLDRVLRFPTFLARNVVLEPKQREVENGRELTELDPPDRVLEAVAFGTMVSANR
ncbi:unnamed protein product [Mycena citricolor]|uniref:Uncharacterized protein n=1 Tax=Mycena citricolor TaxID=2018698 RepID=A0AAD2K3R6_9AGAR|nr:unnamed protein product [Mycena citricolor]CAK5277345.1 unnamed protein product [Mycena citricolor]